MSALTRYVDNRSNKSDAFVVKTQGTVISKHYQRRVRIIDIYLLSRAFVGYVDVFIAVV